jgi:D-arabinan exo alpha-(1,3)/(1,5)-arabinofuranosidase (non-reducing end)
MVDCGDVSVVSPVLDSRAVTFENPTGARGAGGAAAQGRKGRPSKDLAPGELVVLADIEGPGAVRHIWMTFPPAPPEVMRAMTIEVFYDGAADPSVSVPAVDFFGVPHGRPRPMSSALTAVQEGRGFNSFIPLPFADRARIEFRNGSDWPSRLYYQVDYTLHDLPEGAGRLHAAFRRENPTTIKRDFVIAEGLTGPGRFVGCVVGVRTIDGGVWYGEGEVKVYRDGDTDLPTICGTGLEDYVGTAWGMDAHTSHYAGAPLDVRPDGAGLPDFVGFYRWHVLDPVMFESELTVTIQQIGFDVFPRGDEERLARYEAASLVAGDGLVRPKSGDPAALGIVERVDDYCAVAFTMCRDPQPVPRVDVDALTADIARRDYETADPMESFLSALTTG